jgi:methylenetetrahydrofolate dehydrogenase (NADP+)/methenyltetrahydrofolate cyclohydrolase
VKATIIDGRALAHAMRAGQRQRAERLAARGVRAGLAVIVVGDDPASQVYVRRKVEACADVGIASRRIELPRDTSTARLLQVVDELNADPAIHGILVQLPLPPHVDADAALEHIRPEKDVDGFHLHNVGALTVGRARRAPCTPAGVMALLRHTGAPVDGRRAVIIGRSNIVGKPMALLLLAAGATVTIAHSRTGDLAAVTRDADIVVAAAGRPGLVGHAMVKPGATVIDVGINRTEDGRLVGDVEFESVVGVAGAITPVPGGVGPMTVAMLLDNALAAAEECALAGGSAPKHSDASTIS